MQVTSKSARKLPLPSFHLSSAGQRRHEQRCHSQGSQALSPCSGLSYARRSTQAAEPPLPACSAEVAAGNSPCTAAGAAPVTNAESHPPSLLVSQHYLAPYVITTKLPSSEGRGQEALPRALLTEHARIQLYRDESILSHFLLDSPRTSLLLHSALCHSPP